MAARKPFGIETKVFSSIYDNININNNLLFYTIYKENTWFWVVFF